jgi:L-ribulose-5-phosphate 3-epimerase
MRLGYNTNGFAHHPWETALRLIAEIGYESVAITLDHHCLNPFAPEVREERNRLWRVLEELRLGCVIETGARYLLDPRRKHEPTLVSPAPEGRNRRVEFLTHAIDTAAEVGAEAVSLWAGVVRDGARDEVAFERLREGLSRVLEHAERRNMRIAFEPEPGMLIERMDQFARLVERVASPLLGLTIDVGHVHCVDRMSIPDCLRAWRDRVWNIHIEDMCRGVHEHLMFGEGEIDFPPVFAALREIGYSGGVHVELSRHSHVALDAACESYEFLRRAGGEAKSPA